MPHGAITSTPTGEFTQLLGKVYRNLDGILPALYGVVLPMFLEAAAALVLIGALYGWIAILQAAVFIIYTVIVYKTAAGKASRNAQMMKVMMSEYGSILAAASSYERAHFFGNVGHEVSKTRKSFENIGRKITNVMGGDHKEKVWLTTVSMVAAVVFIMLLPTAVGDGDDVSGLEFAALALYFFMFISNLSAYGVGVSGPHKSGKVNRAWAISQFRQLICTHRRPTWGVHRM